MKSLIFLALFSFQLLQGAELGLEPKILRLESDHASFDGKDLTLVGNIHIGHSLGNIFSQKALVKGLDSENKQKALNVFLEEKVQVFFPSEAQLSCGKAHFDYAKKKVSFSGHTPQEKMRFKDLPTKKDATSSLDLQSLSAFAELSDKLNFRALSFFDIQILTFLGEVEITYDAIVAKGGKAVFKRHSVDLEGKEKKFLGILDLYPSLPKDHCRIFHSQGEIYSRKVEFDLLQNTLTFDHPNGSLTFLQKERQPLLFSAKKLNWQKKKNQWVLEESVYLDERDIAQFESDQITLFQKENGALYKTVAIGKSKMTFIGKEKRVPQLLCDGTIVLDNDSKKITATAEKERVFFYDGSLFLSSKEALFFYDAEKQKLTPQRISFAGDVHFISDDVLDSQTLGVADEITYLPQEQRLILNSSHDKKVLLWQENNSLKLSAHEIQIERDPFTSKEIAKGVGDVRFSFDTAEEDLLKKTFGSYLKIK